MTMSCWSPACRLEHSQGQRRLSGLKVLILAVLSLGEVSCGYVNLPGGGHSAVVYGQTSAASRSQVDFSTQVLPILKVRCFPCHGPEIRSGGLRLDRRSDVAQGGYSQAPLLSPSLAKNEIYLRVASSDSSYRMPKGQPALAPQEVAAVRRWVESGARWPADSQFSAIHDVSETLPTWSWDEMGAAAERWLNEVPMLIPWLSGILILQFCLLFVERWRQANLAGRKWTQQGLGRCFQFCAAFQIWHYLLIQACMFSTLLLLVTIGQHRKRLELEQALAELKLTAPVGGQPTTYSVYGNPPVPKHPGHAPALSHVYYRGNCERSPKLFNGGNYRTATLRIAVVDELGRELQVGDKIHPRNFRILFELERPRGTTDALYGDSISRGVFLTSQFLSDQKRRLEKPLFRLNATIPGWKWSTVVRIQEPEDEHASSLQGLIYVYQGSVENNAARGTVHYGIKYNIRLNQFVIQPESEIWMGNLFWSSVLQLPSEGKIPLQEWFDDEPIPEITGPNSTDPLLLGIPEHQKKSHD